MANINSFTKKYSTTLTLKNELKPVGATIDYIHERCLIVEDEQRSEDYKKAKIIIDAFHQKFIDFVLDNVTNLSWGELQATMISLRKAQKEKWTSKNKIFDDCKRAYDDECKKCRNSIHKLFSDSKRVFSVKEILLGSTNERFNIPDTDIQFSYKDLFGKKLIKTVLPSILISKCKCGPVEFPVLPTLAITSPGFIFAPTFVKILEQCAYQVSTPFP